MERITNKDLEYLVQELNAAMGFTGDVYGKPGAYTISGAYGGVKLEQFSEGGGVRTISCDGYGTKRQLYTFLQGYLAGMRKAKEGV